MFTPVQTGYASERVADQIRELIASGELAPGTRLPSQDQLAQSFSVSRSSVREAIKALEATGMVEVKHGCGTFVAERFESRDPTLWLMEHSDDVLDLLEVREALETKAAYLAAERSTPEETERLFEIAREMEGALHKAPLPELEKLDRCFHDAVVELSRSPLLLRLTRGIEKVMSDRRALLAIKGRGELSVQEHFAIAEAIRDGKPDLARERMAAHKESAKSMVRRIRVDQVDGRSGRR